MVGEYFVPGIMKGEAVEEAGLLASRRYTRAASGNGQFETGVREEDDPRLCRVVGEHGVRTFEIR